MSKEPKIKKGGNMSLGGLYKNRFWILVPWLIISSLLAGGIYLKVNRKLGVILFLSACALGILFSMAINVSNRITAREEKEPTFPRNKAAAVAEGLATAIGSKIAILVVTAAAGLFLFFRPMVSVYLILISTAAIMLAYLGQYLLRKNREGYKKIPHSAKHTSHISDSNDKTVKKLELCLREEGTRDKRQHTKLFGQISGIAAQDLGQTLKRNPQLRGKLATAITKALPTLGVEVSRGGHQVKLKQAILLPEGDIERLSPYIQMLKELRNACKVTEHIGKSDSKMRDLNICIKEELQKFLDNNEAGIEERCHSSRVEHAWNELRSYLYPGVRTVMDNSDAEQDNGTEVNPDFP